MDIKRGDIVYVEIPFGTGHEMLKNRPAVVISNNAMNYAGQVVSVVYMSGSAQADRPYHVGVKGTVNARHSTSTVLCEHIYTVDKSRLGKYMGHCSEEELEAIDRGILMTLALGDGRYKRGQTIERHPEPEAWEDDENEEEPACAELAEAEKALAATQAELETYKRIYEALLDRVVGGAE